MGSWVGGRLPLELYGEMGRGTTTLEIYGGLGKKTTATTNVWIVG